MTAEKVSDKIAYAGNPRIDSQILTHKQCIDLVIEYAKGKCKEQRELCSNVGIGDVPDNITLTTRNKVLNAPKPKFE